MITIPYTIYATDYNQIDCGHWNFSVSFGTITDPCSKITGIDNFQWKNISFPGGSVYDTYGETAHGQDVNFHLPDDVKYEIELKFTVHTLCGDYHPTRNFEVTQGDECPGGCTASFCYEETFCMSTEPFYTRVDWILFSGNQQFIVFGPGHANYNGPYYFYGGGVCQFTPDMQDMIDDLNAFLDGSHSGHAVLKYYDANDPGYNGCKIRIRVRESDLMMEYVQASNYYFTPCIQPPLVPTNSCPGIFPIEESNQCQFNNHTVLDQNPAVMHQIIKEVGLEQYYFPDVNNGFNTKIKPNISRDLIDINIQSSSKSNYIVEFFDLSGKSVLKEVDIAPNQDRRLNATSLPPGMYIIRFIQMDSGDFMTNNFIKL